MCQYKLVDRNAVSSAENSAVTEADTLTDARRRYQSFEDVLTLNLELAQSHQKAEDIMKLPEILRVDFTAHHYRAQIEKRSQQQQGIILVVGRSPVPMAVYEICDVLGITHNTMTNQLKELRGLGYVESFRDPANQRVVRYRVCDAQLSLYCIWKHNSEFRELYQNGRIDRENPRAISLFIEEAQVGDREISETLTAIHSQSQHLLDYLQSLTSRQLLKMLSKQEFPGKKDALVIAVHQKLLQTALHAVVESDQESTDIDSEQ
jgi:DNA-binding MarR family transcriptional regulator